MDAFLNVLALALFPGNIILVPALVMGLNKIGERRLRRRYEVTDRVLYTPVTDPFGR